MNYHNITYPDMNNGDGLRVVLWLSGCSHHCYNCQNPQTWDENSGILFDESAKEELFRELNKDYISGLTLSGGDPLYINNIESVLRLVNEIRHIYGKSKTIWLYTGYIFEEIFGSQSLNGLKIEHINKDGLIKVSNGKELYLRQQIIKQCDVMVDGRYINSLRDVSLKWRGSSNQRVIELNKTFERSQSLNSINIVLHE